MKRIFITGVAGFLGSHLADAFLAKGWQVVGNDNFLGGYEDNIPKGVEFHKVDCTDLVKMKEIMAGADVVYHCAATAYEGLSVFSPTLVTENIVQSGVSTMTAAIHNKVKRFVLCSSMARYGTNEVPFREDMQPRPQDPYAIGKYASELFLRNLSQVHGMEYVIAVPHNIIGPRQKYDDPFRNVASIMINLMLQGKQPIIYGDGEQKRCFSFVQDDVDPLVMMAEADNVVGEVINIGPDGPFVTINELAQTIAKILDFKLDPRRLPDRPQEVKLANCSADKARRLLGYNAKTNLEDGLRSIVDYVRQRGPLPFDYSLPVELKTEKTPRSWTERLF
jgi:UDP-glucose 4-epimerase